VEGIHKKAESIIQKALEIYPEEEIPEEVPEALPLLNEFRKARPDPKAFAGVETLYIQHHLGPLVPRIQNMIEDGQDPERCWAIDIPYSTSNIVREGTRKLGCLKEQWAEPFNDPLKPYSESQLQRVMDLIQRLVEKLASEKDRRDLLVVDDGAYFLRAISNLPENEKKRMIEVLKNRTHIVEQTTRGYRYIKQRENMETAFALGAPVVSVARNYTKCFLESPFIGASVSRGIVLKLREAGERDIARTLVIGYGKVGEATTHALVSEPQVKHIEVFDINPDLAEAIKAASAHPIQSFPESGHYDLVLGCTGYASFPLEKRSLLADEAMLVSGSSAAVELNREKFVELADKLPDDEIEIMDKEATRRKGIHASIKLRDAKRSFSFLNAGFPVNFDGTVECLPARFIQPTHGLLFAASRQAMRTKGPGLSFLNYDDDFWIYENGLKMIEKHTSA
jgi:hypothetical protein